MKRQTLIPIHGSLDMAHICEVLRRANANGKHINSLQPLQQSVADLRKQVIDLDVEVRKKCNGG